MSMYYVGGPEYHASCVSEEELKAIKKEWKKAIDTSKVRYKAPILKANHSYWMYEAFDLMHKQDGTRNRSRCDTSYL